MSLVRYTINPDGTLEKWYLEKVLDNNETALRKTPTPKFNCCMRIFNTEILRQYFINHPQSIDKYTFLQNSAFTHWVKEKCSKMC